MWLTASWLLRSPLLTTVAVVWTSHRTIWPLCQPLSPAKCIGWLPPRSRTVGRTGPGTAGCVPRTRWTAAGGDAVRSRTVTTSATLKPLHPAGGNRMCPPTVGRFRSAHARQLTAQSSHQLSMRHPFAASMDCSGRPETSLARWAPAGHLPGQTWTATTTKHALTSSQALTTPRDH